MHDRHPFALTAAGAVALVATWATSGHATTISRLARCDEFTLVAPDELPARVDLVVTLDGVPVTLALERHTVRSPEARLLVDCGEGPLVDTPLPPARTYRGTIVGEPGSGVAAALLEDGLVALVERGSGDRFHVEPLARLEPSAGAVPATHVAYRRGDVRDAGHRCGFDDLDPLRVSSADGGDDGGIAGATTYLAEIGIDADFEFFTKNGSSVELTVADIESIMVQVEFIYHRDVDVDYEITTIIVRSSASDPYTATNSSDLLCEFRTAWNAAPENQIQREVAHLFTGKNLDGGTIGVGWLGVVCNDTANACTGALADVAYSLVESKFAGATTGERVGLSCHELGHNWGATHCDGEGDCHIMCSSIDQCDGIVGANLKFGAGEVTEIVNYRNSVSCDLALSAPLTIPFTEAWPNAGISTSRWVFNNGGLSVTAATNEPSPSFSLNLDATGAGLYEDDEIRSHVLFASGAAPSLTLSYFTQHVGVESGETLSVDYWSAAGKWETVETLISSGVNQTTFTPSTAVLPANALHDGLRIRFRAGVNETNDDWYIDDIELSQTSTCTADLDADGDVDASDLAVIIGAWGPCSGCPADLTGNGVVGSTDITLLLAVWGPCSL